MELLEVIQMFF